MIKSGESLEYVVDSLINDRRIKSHIGDIDRFEIMRSASRNSLSPFKSPSGSTLPSNNFVR